MLVFDDEFVLSGQRNRCNLWAREPKLKRVCFSIDTNLLPNALKGEHIDLVELELCELSVFESKPPVGARLPIGPVGRSNCSLAISNKLMTRP